MMSEIQDGFAGLRPNYPGDAYGFIGPIKPPSADHSKRTAKWDTDFLMACAYCWGRMDAGESLDSNQNYRWANMWADASWEYDNQYRTHMPAMWGAFACHRDGVRF